MKEQADSLTKLDKFENDQERLSNELNKIETEQEALKNQLETKSNSLNICEKKLNQFEAHQKHEHEESESSVKSPRWTG